MPVYSLPILYVLSFSFQLVKMKWRQLLRLSWPYWLVTLSSQYIIPQNQQGYSAPHVFLWIVFIMMIAAWTTVQLHRSILLDSSSITTSSIATSNNASSQFGTRELKMIGYWILIGGGLFSLLIGCTLIFVYLFEEKVASLPVFVLYLLFSLPCCWLFSRWSLVIPAIAIDAEPRGLKVAWSLSKPYQGPLFILLGLFPYGITMLFTFFAQWGGVSEQAHWVFNLLTYFCWLYQICILSITYQWITRRKQIDHFLDMSPSGRLVSE
ncbi:hypothetical protein [Vibrio fujianensis]|uniref:hypothetical protein n=1 Tax=Vibrio fujianensis TaxID=1974215 RepID=UPI0012FFE2F7|nr:hypothetical protein [Vibrio fujianensis]